jgi:hypothetical protein
MGISKEVYDAGQELTLATSSTIADELNRVLNRFLKWPFQAATGDATDADGQTTDTFGTIIFTTSGSCPETGGVHVSADSLASIIDLYERMDLEQFREAYQRVARAKRLRKTPPRNIGGPVYITGTLGIILAIQAVVPLEKLAEELERLNAQTPCAKWPDMVVVLSAGIINYAVQFPGENLEGDFLLPPERALNNNIPPFYVVTVMKPTGTQTFNKMLAFLIGHLTVFSPGANLPDRDAVQEGVPMHAITLCGYQYDLSGKLVPVPRQFYRDRYLAPPPLRIEDSQGKLLASVRFLPWQDGGVVILNGNFPLEGFLLFADRDVLKGQNIFSRPGAKISPVLPITQQNFNEMLARMQNQSNMVARREPLNLVSQKFADEGSSSPFWARLFMGILRLADVVFPDAGKREEFHKIIDLLINELLNTRSVVREINKLWSDHARKIAQGEIVRVEASIVHISENIDAELRRQTESFLNTATRALKNSMQDVATFFGVNIGFLFQNQNLFVQAVEQLAITDVALAEYLRQTRTNWSQTLLTRRIALEHDRWMLPKVTYSRHGDGARAIEPQIAGQPVSQFANFMLDRLFCFVEEISVHCLERRMPHGVTITEIPLSQREAEKPERFQVTITPGGMLPWGIVYHQTAFENT